MSSGYHKEYDSPESGLDAHRGREASERIGLLNSQPALSTADVEKIDDGHRLMLGDGARGNSYASKHALGSLLGGIIGGIVTCLAIQASLSEKDSSCLEQSGGNEARANNLRARAEPWAGSTYANSYPPATPTNYFPSLFPSDIGYLGATPTGAEPAIIVTAPSQPIHTGGAALVVPAYSLFPESSSNEPDFNIFRNWGHLSPWYSVPVGTFGINEGAAPPEGCHVQGVYLLYRHGASYPSVNSSAAGLAQDLYDSADKWTASGSLEFLNDWTYKLGEDSGWFDMSRKRGLTSYVSGNAPPSIIVCPLLTSCVLTAFGRQQEYDLGVSMRLKYGFLLDNFTAENRLPVFRTTSLNRMVASGTNFALGFFGWPIEGQFEQEIMIESPGFNNTLAPWENCPNANNDTLADRGNTYTDAWRKVYLSAAKKRLQTDLSGFKLHDKYLHAMQDLCAHETVALGYSQFCDLFTEEEWIGFNYYNALKFWYNDAFGSPVARVQGLGYVQELVSRLTQTPIEIYNSSTNSTWDSDPKTWPLGNVLYADATHDVVIANILTALNLTSLAASGPLPSDEIPSNQTFFTNELVPYGSNIQFQLLSCPAIYGGSDDGTYMRIVINDGPVPLTGVGDCPESESGLCPLSTFTAAQQYTSETVDWYWGCYGNWSVPEGSAWETTGGWYPPPPTN